MPPNAYDVSWGQDGIWIASQLLRQIESLDPPMRLSRRPLRASESELSQSRTTNQRNMTAQFPIQNNLCELCLGLEAYQNLFNSHRSLMRVGKWQSGDLNSGNLTPCCKPFYNAENTHKVFIAQSLSHSQNSILFIIKIVLEPFIMHT